MAQFSTGTAAPSGLRVIQNKPGKSLIVALPLTSSASVLHQSSASNTFADAVALPTHDRAFWRRLSYTPQLLKVGTILRGLGLRHLPNSKRIIFQYNNVSKLADAVAEVLKRLPTTLEKLLDAAANYQYAPLQEEIALLLYRFGDEIWGAGKGRPWLLQASEDILEYPKDLVFGDAADQEVMIYYLRLWILVKAFNSLRTKFQPHAKQIPDANKDELIQRNSTRPINTSSLSRQDLQPFTCGDVSAATSDLVATTSRLETVPSTTSETETLPLNNSAQIRRTARTPKPQKDIVYIHRDSDGFTDGLSQLEENSADNVPRHYKGKGRAWEKTETYGNPAFLSKRVRRSSKLRTSGILPQPTPRLRGRPKGSKNAKVLPREFSRDVESDPEAILPTEREERRSKRLRKEALSTPAQASASAHWLPDQKGSQRPRREYLSEEVVRNSSDDSKDDNEFTQTSIEPAIGNGTTPQSRPDHGGEFLPPTKSVSRRQPPGACEWCRRRRQKCDRTLPRCGRCTNHGFPCEYLLKPASTAPVESTSRPVPREEQAVLHSQPSPEHVNSKHDSSGQPATNATMWVKKIDLLLDKYWNEDGWRYFYLRANERQVILATMRSLGLKATPQHRIHFRFDIENFVSLDKDVNKIAGKLCRESSAAELIRFAADPSYLDKEIDLILDTYTYIWSLDADRTELLAPGSEPHYSKHLSYEDDEDRKLLRIHLHRWIFIIALKNCKPMYGAGVRNMNGVVDAEVPEDMLDQWQLEGTDTVEEPKEFSTASRTGSDAFISTTEQTLEPAPESADEMFADPTLQEHETHLLEALGQYLAEKQRGQHEQQDKETANASAPEPATQKPSRSRQKRKDSTIAGTEQPDIFRPCKQRRINLHRTTPKGHEFAALFMSYLENFADPKFDELAALKNIAIELSVLEEYASGFKTKKGTASITTFFAVTLPTWLGYRKEIVEIKRKIAAMQLPEESSHRQLAMIERSRLATQLRLVHEKFMKAGHDGLRPEPVIYRGMILLMNEEDDSQTAGEILTGLKGMEDELKHLGDQLMQDGGAQWVMGDFVSVAMLKDL